MAGSKWDEKKFRAGPDPRRVGKRAGTRWKLQTGFIADLAADWEEHGAGVIRIVRAEEPSKYLSIIASLMPRELAIEASVASDLDDDMLAQMFETLRQQLLAQAGAEPTKLLELKNDHARVD